MHISKVKLPFYPPCEVKCGLQNGVSTNAANTDVHLIQLCRKCIYASIHALNLHHDVS